MNSKVTTILSNAIFFVALSLLSSCSNQKQRFTELAGFDKIRSMQSNELPTLEELQLLEKFKPILYVGDGQEGPIDFYLDYVEQGCLELPNTEPDCSVGPEKLNAVKENPLALFTHDKTTDAITPVAYASIYKAFVDLENDQASDEQWTFLRYHFVFRTSGISAGISGWQEVLFNLVGNLDDWHQLDHYTSVVVALKNNEPKLVLLQQHNYMRTYLINVEPAFSYPGDFKVVAALRSNELYPYRAEKKNWRTVSFLSSDNVEWMDGTSEKIPMLGAIDIADPHREVDYELTYLTPSDAFYVFQGTLGEKRLLPGRNGPPGAIYNTLPQIWEYEKAMAVFYWTEPDKEFTDIFKDVSFHTIQETIKLQKLRLAKALKNAGLL